MRYGPKLASILFIASIFCAAPSAKAEDFGKFLDPLNVSLDNSDGRKLTLLNDYRFMDSQGRIWVAKKGWIVDGASIPQWLWSIVGGPLEGLYRNASVVHDYYCDTKERSWQETHRVFYYGMRATGVAEVRAKIMYYAVYAYGPRWDKVETGEVVVHMQSLRTCVQTHLGPTCSLVNMPTTQILRKEVTLPRPMVPPDPADVEALKSRLESGESIDIEQIERLALARTQR